LYDVQIETLITLLFACCFGSAMAQSNLPTCEGDRAAWTDCFGSHTFASGNKYVGEFKGNQKNGRGTSTFADGDKYVGEYKDGKYNGRGTYTSANGNEYVGEYKDGKRNGQFIVTYADGVRYVGEYKDDKKTGRGIKFLANGKVDQSGIWKDGVLVQSKFIDVATFERTPGSRLRLGSLSPERTPLTESGTRLRCTRAVSEIVDAESYQIMA
jgi:hypothetical protein